MPCFQFHNLKRHLLIAVSVMDSLTRDWKVSRNEGSKPHQAACSSDTLPSSPKLTLGLSNCSFWLLPSGATANRSHPMVFATPILLEAALNPALSPLCSTVNKPSFPPMLPEGHLHKAPPCPHHTLLETLCSFSKSFCPEVHTLKASTDKQPHWCYLASARKRRISVPVCHYNP